MLDTQQLDAMVMHMRVDGLVQGMRGEGILQLQLYYINLWLTLAFHAGSESSVGDGHCGDERARGQEETKGP